MKNILLTGGVGFIGSNFIPFFLTKYEDYRIINLDKMTYAGNMDNLEEVKSHKNYHFIKGDIGNRELVEYIFDEFDIHDIIHFAAESHVDNSIKVPEVFIQTNINGTFVLLDVSNRKWMNQPFEYREKYKESRFLHVSTDEVYGTLGKIGTFTEETPYAPNSPYAASKAASDMLVRSYHHTFGLNAVITNCSNNYGPKQHDEKLIPTIIRNALQDRKIPIYGDGKNVRDWLYVLDHCKGIDIAFHRGKAGETYNIGGRNERENIYIANNICEILDDLCPRKDGQSYKNQISFIKDRPGHDKRYAIDATKIEKKLEWFAEENFETGVLKTVKWYIEKYCSTA